MLAIIFPCSVKRILPRNNRAERIFFVRVFKENNSHLRQKLFSDPLVKYLWSRIFIEESAETSITYLKSIKSQTEQGTLKFERFHKDMKELEIICNFKMLPDAAHY